MLHVAHVVFGRRVVVDDHVDGVDQVCAEREFVRRLTLILHILVDHFVLAQELLPSLLQVGIRASEDVLGHEAFLFDLLYRTRLAQCLKVGLM